MVSKEIFLFVNPKSGGQTGEEILEVQQPFEVQVADGTVVNLRIFSLLDGPPGQKPGFQALKEASYAASCSRAIVAGGDGTVKWALEESKKHGIAAESKVLFGILPLGTGNDFSRAMGWGGKLPASLAFKGWERVLSDMVQQWWVAPSRWLDVWKVKLCVDGGCGEIDVVNSDRVSESLQDSEIETTMINYFSVGLDGRMGFGFDKHRTNSRMCNLGVYIYEAFKKTLPCNPQQRITQFVGRLYAGTSAEGTCIFDTTELDDSSPTTPRTPRLVTEKPRLLVVLNIASYGGGSAHFWKGAKRLGVDRPVDPQLLHAMDDPGDGKLEVVSVRNLPTVALDPVAHYTSFVGPKRIFSGAPLFMTFKDSEEADCIAFCQIDGEFYKLVNPESASVNYDQHVRVLYNPGGVEENILEDLDEDTSCSD